MSILSRSTSKRDKARRAVRKKSKQAKRWGVRKTVQKVVPKRVLVIFGGAGTAVAAATVAKKRSGSSASDSAQG
jgi:hypothetical protein